MSKRSGQKKRSGAQFLQLYHSMLDCPAWQSLKPTPRATYVEIAMRFKGNNNGTISISIRELESRLHVGKSSVGRAINELVEKRFIEVVTPSGFSRKDRKATEYRLTSHFCNVTESAASKAYMKWSPKKKEQSQPKDTTVPSQVQYAAKEPEIASHGPNTGTENREFGT